MSDAVWHDLGPAEALQSPPLRQLVIGRTRIALSYSHGVFGAISGTCNHAGGPLGEGRLDGEYVTCPWHNWKYHRSGGQGEPGYESEAVPRHDVRVEGGRVLVNLEPATRRHKIPHPPHPLERKLLRAPGPIRVAGISTTAMDAAHPRVSTSGLLLEAALSHAAAACHSETRYIKLNELKFRHCEGYYSKSAHACTWPCSITQMDPDDQLDQVYDALVFWADVVLVATPIRWGVASSLYFKMAERLNCVLALEYCAPAQAGHKGAPQGQLRCQGVVPQGRPGDNCVSPSCEPGHRLVSLLARRNPEIGALRTPGSTNLGAL